MISEWFYGLLYPELVNADHILRREQDRILSNKMAASINQFDKAISEIIDKDDNTLDTCLDLASYLRKQKYKELQYDENIGFVWLSVSDDNSIQYDANTHTVNHQSASEPQIEDVKINNDRKN